VADYTRLADAGELDAARALSASLGPARDAFDRWLRTPWTEHGTIPIAQLKEWLGLMGLSQGPVRPPLAALAEDERGELRRNLEALGLLG
jgi:dihydrodipicolinate synthase/N-acetylneuraminate lyase